MAQHFKYEGALPKRAILFGDPARASLLEGSVDGFEELFFNREFRGVRVSNKGKEALLLSCGIGGPSTAIAMEEAYMLGVREFIRVGTCGVVDRNIGVGDIVVASAAIKEDGVSKELLPSSVPALPSANLTNRLGQKLREEELRYFEGVVRTHDIFYESEEEFIRAFEKYRDVAIASEMEMATVFTVSMKLGAASAGMLVVNTPEYIDWEKRKVEDITYLAQGNAIDDKLRKALLLAVAL
ncbi:MAG: hypothetical protein D6769_00640 [Methanobacteriota archaeon]|nr:MAG: hypothetical protein D6769_00640 [Euryarchaeota archaeon]